MSSAYEDIYKAIVRHQGQSQVGVQTRLIKLSEEVGEVMQAYIGTTGANKRKGVTHIRADVADELCDVIITAMVALHDWTEYPGEWLEDRVNAVAGRVEEQGS